MNRTLHKNDIIDMISEKLRGKKIVVGGNKYAYKRKYHLKYGEKIIRKVLDAFLDVITEAITKGNSIQVYRYMTIYPQHYKERTVNMFDGTSGHISPEHFKVKVKEGKKLKEACRTLMNSISKGELENE